MCSVWDPVPSHGPVRNRRQFLSPPQRLNIEGLLRQDVKLFSFVGCSEICRYHQHDRLLCLLITKALSSQHEIQSSMNEPSMWMFTVITYDSWLKTRLQICSMFLPQIRLQTFSPRLLVLISLSKFRVQLGIVDRLTIKGGYYNNR